MQAQCFVWRTVWQVTVVNSIISYTFYCRPTTTLELKTTCNVEENYLIKASKFVFFLARFQSNEKKLTALSYPSVWQFLCPSFGIKQFGSHSADFITISYWKLPLKSIEKIQVWMKWQKKNSVTLHKDVSNFTVTSCWILHWKKFSNTSYKENRNTLFI